VSVARAGEEFREDLRAPGARNAEARRLLTSAELAPLTRLSTWRSLASLAQTFALIAAAIAFAVALWPGPWMAAGIVASVVAVGIAQHGLFILAHEAAHYRLFPRRGANDAVGRLVGMVSGISMCTYRVTHRLHHNNLYTEEDPDTAIHGGYPRGQRYLRAKLWRDLLGLNAWKTFAYFFGAPAINDATQRLIRPLDDTSPELRAAARRDRWWVVGFHAAAPVAAFTLGGGPALLLYLLLWVLPLVTVLQPILRVRAILEHGAVDDLSSPLTAARTNRTWGSALNVAARAVLFPHHVNYHLEHHLYPAVPHYHLPRLHRLLLAKGALAGAEVRDVAGSWARVYAERRQRA
jgi:fatty acid desaturase